MQYHLFCSFVWDPFSASVRLAYWNPSWLLSVCVFFNYNLFIFTFSTSSLSINLTITEVPPLIYKYNRFRIHLIKLSHSYNTCTLWRQNVWWKLLSCRWFAASVGGEQDSSLTIAARTTLRLTCLAARQLGNGAFYSCSLVESLTLYHAGSG